ncbi:hypothetical protein LTR60_005400, partial [Cryomyces antarcticus]
MDFVNEFFCLLLKAVMTSTGADPYGANDVYRRESITTQEKHIGAAAVPRALDNEKDMHGNAYERRGS